MPIAKTRLELAQIVKVIQSVRHSDRDALEKLGTCGIPFILDYNEPQSGDFPLGVAASQQDPELVRVLPSCFSFATDFPFWLFLMPPFDIYK